MKTFYKINSLSYVKGFFVFFVPALLLFSLTILQPNVTAHTTSEKYLKILRSDQHAIEIELTIRDYHIETTAYHGQLYQKINIPDMPQCMQPGKPQVPTYGTLLGIPTIEGVSLQILSADYETLRGYRLSPAAEFNLTKDNMFNLQEGRVKQYFSINQEIYTTNAFYPGAVATLNNTGFMRNLPVTHVQFSPVQYNPVTEELRMYRNIRIKITWKSSSLPKTIGASQDNPAYEYLLRNTILNYHFLNRYPDNNTYSNLNTANITRTSSDTVPALKIGIIEDGIYKLTYTDLVNAGYQVSNRDPRKIMVRNKGMEIPILVIGEEDGVFDTTDYILFYGTALHDIYTVKNIYWLTTGESNGIRIATRDGTLSGNALIPAYFPTTFHAEEDSYYWQNIANGKGQDHWFWGGRITAPETRDYSLTLGNISHQPGTATVRVCLRGRTSDPNTNPDHYTKFYINNIQIDEKQWDGTTIIMREVPIPHSYLYEGTNTVRVEQIKQSNVIVDQVVVNWIEIAYNDTYVAENDILLFNAPGMGNFQFDVSGFTNNDIKVFDVTNSANVILITNTTIQYQGGTFTIQFEDASKQETRYLAQTTSQYKLPESIEIDQPSSWKSPDNGADYIIITHGDFYDSALRLANYRSALGLRAVVVKTDDIYDEFNFGIFNPQAIRDFLTYAYNNWITAAPLYVLLMGDACQDYKDNLKTGTKNYVPSQITETTGLGETPSDNWFVLVHGDDILPDMFIGRLSAQTQTQADDIIDKIIAYEQHSPDKSWNKNVLFVADDDDPSFTETSEQIAHLLPVNYIKNKIYLKDYTSGNPTSDIINNMNNGSVLVNYSGHGTVFSWGLWDVNKYFFHIKDIPSLGNYNLLPFVSIMNCLNGFFTGIKPEVSLAEGFQSLKDRGAVAIWAATGMSYPSGHRLLIQNLYTTVFQHNQFGLGAATTSAKIATYAQDNTLGELVEMYVLFGDPFMQLGIGSRLSLITPNGKETLTANSDYIIQWVASRDMVNFTLKYSTNKGHTWKNMARGIKGSTYTWRVPGFGGKKKNCLVKITGFDSNNERITRDLSDSTFTIKGLSATEQTSKIQSNF